MTTREGDLHRSCETVRYAIVVILIHLGVSLVHARTHSRLGIGLNAAQEIFVGVVVIIAPPVAGYLLWKDNVRSGGALLAASMAGALVFGIFYHFIAPGADNVNHQFPLGLTNWKRFFDQTAVGIAVLELIGLILGLILALNSDSRTSKGKKRPSIGR
jgi:hypothetical protein